MTFLSRNDQRGWQLSGVFCWMCRDARFNLGPGVPAALYRRPAVNPFLWAFDTVSRGINDRPHKKVSYSGQAYVSVFSRLNTRIYHPAHCTTRYRPRRLGLVHQPRRYSLHGRLKLTVSAYRHAPNGCPPIYLFYERTVFPSAGWTAARASRAPINDRFRVD